MLALATDTWTYWRVMWGYVAKSEPYGGATVFVARGYAEEEARRMGVHVFSLALALRLWDRPHYRKSSYAADVRDNFRNVAVPGTGVPLSILARHKVLTVAFLAVGYPFACLCAAVAHVRRNAGVSLRAAYREQLLAPKDWFSLWRINSRLAAWHSLVTRRSNGDSESWHDYAMENKWTFLEKGLELGVPVSPVLSKPVRLCVKHKNEEGGLGIYFYENALNGGDWIIQEVMDNAEAVATLLPADAPLSTFRVMTASKASLLQGNGPPLTEEEVFFPLSCVFRAGRAGAATDHSSILFDVDVRTGTIGRGTTNAQWYRLYETRVPWGPPPPIYDHPDTGARVSGHTIPDFHAKVLQVAVDAHKALLPNVPLAGWDVVLAKQHGPCLLEANLSCNFFRGSFDEALYYGLIHDFFAFCQRREDLQLRSRRATTTKLA
mmetsp:Transcript_6552/g.20455  ORF Transcript_6552/g.20455 Transcript_6552/m.20455 type:complete len:435 (+) Transcript_6552:50-1354(+)